MYQSVEKIKTIMLQICKTTESKITAQTIKLHGRKCQRPVYYVYQAAIWNY